MGGARLNHVAVEHRVGTRAGRRCGRDGALAGQMAEVTAATPVVLGMTLLLLAIVASARAQFRVCERSV